MAQPPQRSERSRARIIDAAREVLVEGGERVRIKKFIDENGYFEAWWDLLPVDDTHTQQELDVAMRSLVSLFEQYVKLNRKIPPEFLNAGAAPERCLFAPPHLKPAHR